MSVDDTDPDAVVAALKREGLPVFKRGDYIGNDARLREIFDAARRGGWSAALGRGPRPREINRGRWLRRASGVAVMRALSETDNSHVP